MNVTLDNKIFNKISLSVVVAAYNEEAVIAQNIQRICKELAKRDEVTWELICVNDGSQDKTGDLMENAAREDNRIHVIHHRRNFGQGRALRAAFDICRGDVCVTLDADLSYGPEYIYRLVDALSEKNVEIVLASPYTKGGSVRNVPFYRHFLSRFGNLYLGWMSNYRISTSTCVVRAYRHEVLDSIVLTSDGTELQLEVLMKASILGFQACEIPAFLEWPDIKASKADIKRVSKMRILRTIRLYLLMGWLFRPALFFMGISLLLTFASVFMLTSAFYRVFQLALNLMHLGLWQAISLGLQKIFENYTYGLIIYGGMFLVGIQIFVYSLTLIQNKYHYDELYRLVQMTRSSKK